MVVDLNNTHPIVIMNTFKKLIEDPAFSAGLAWGELKVTVPSEPKMEDYLKLNFQIHQNILALWDGGLQMEANILWGNFTPRTQSLS